MRIRPATADDVGALARTLAAAFAGYPWTHWIVDGRDHEERLRAMYEIFIGLAVDLGEVRMADDAGAAAAWTWSGDAAAAAEWMAARGYDARTAELAGDRLAAAVEANELLARHQPAEPHWYLNAIGVAPGRQGRGLGTRVLEPTLARLDREGLAAALDTSSERNVDLYRRLGFEVYEEGDAPGGGPHVWFMECAPTRR